MLSIIYWPFFRSWIKFNKNWVINFFEGLKKQYMFIFLSYHRGFQWQDHLKIWDHFQMLAFLHVLTIKIWKWLQMVLYDENKPFCFLSSFENINFENNDILFSLLICVRGHSTTTWTKIWPPDIFKTWQKAKRFIFII